MHLHNAELASATIFEDIYKMEQRERDYLLEAWEEREACLREECLEFDDLMSDYTCDTEFND